MTDIRSSDNIKTDLNKRKFAQLFAGSKKITVTAEWGTPGFGFSQCERVADVEKDFACLIDQYNCAIEAIDAGFDNVPMLSFSFGAVAWLMALAYDCEMIKINSLINARPRYADMTQARRITTCINV